MKSRRLMFASICLLVLMTSGAYTAAQQEKVAEKKDDVKKADIDFVMSPKGARYRFRIVTTLSNSKIVAGAPYSATATTEMIHTLGDGNQIIRKNDSRLYRDSQGRIRIEQTLEAIGKWVADGKPRQTIFIGDVVSRSGYNLDPATKTACRGRNPEVNTRVEVAQFYLKPLMLTVLPRPTITYRHSPPGKTIALSMEKEAVHSGDDSRRKHESLGTQTIEGVLAEGERSTLTIPAGEIGNTRPIEVVDEKWYSPELQVVVMSKYLDPRNGNTIYRLSNIDRSEPDRSLFVVPSDYRIVSQSAFTKIRTKNEERR